MLDLALTIGHHLAVFSIAAILAVEITTLRPGIAGARITDLARYDGAIGAASMLALVIGFSRVFFGDAPSSYYFANPVFWMKIGTFILIGLLSIAPTISIARWRKAVVADPAFAAPDAEVARARKFFLAEAGFFVLIPAFAAAMANGIGL